MDYLSDIKLRLQAKDVNISDPLIESYINQMLRRIKNLCNVITIPEELEYVVVDLTCNVINTDFGDEKISALKEGDTQINFVVESVNNTISDNYNELIRFRNLKW